MRRKNNRSSGVAKGQIWYTVIGVDAPNSILLQGILTPAFGGGLTFCSHVIRWGERVTPLAQSSVELPPCERSALEMARDYMGRRDPNGRSAKGLAVPVISAAA